LLGAERPIEQPVPGESNRWVIGVIGARDSRGDIRALALLLVDATQPGEVKWKIVDHR
jgi:hypothetical protein